MKVNRKRGLVATVVAVVGIVLAVTGLVGAAVGQPYRSSSDVLAFADPGTPVGESTLRRTDDEVRMKLRATGQSSREALTVWWVVFNQPENCTAPACDTDDIFVDGDPSNPLNEDQIAAADIVAAYATGKVANAEGKVNFSATLEADEPTGTREIIFGEGSTLKDSAGAEVHLVVRTHGPAQPGEEDEQTGSFAGGCDVFLNPPAVPTAVGECADTLFSVHAPN